MTWSAHISPSVHAFGPMWGGRDQNFTHWNSVQQVFQAESQRSSQPGPEPMWRPGAHNMQRTEVRHLRDRKPNSKRIEKNAGHPSPRAFPRRGRGFQLGVRATGAPQNWGEGVGEKGSTLASKTPKNFWSIENGPIFFSIKYIAKDDSSKPPRRADPPPPPTHTNSHFHFFCEFSVRVTGYGLRDPGVSLGRILGGPSNEPFLRGGGGGGGWAFTRGLYRPPPPPS